MENSFDETRLTLMKMYNYPEGIITDESFTTNMEFDFERNGKKYTLCYDIKRSDYKEKEIEDFIFDTFYIKFKKDKPKYLDLSKHPTLTNINYYFKSTK